MPWVKEDKKEGLLFNVRQNDEATVEPQTISSTDDDSDSASDTTEDMDETEQGNWRKATVS